MNFMNHLKNKKFLIGILFLFVNFQIFSASKSEASIFAELNSAFQSKAYPGVIEYCVQLENEYPRSRFLAKAFLFKGESFYFLNRFDESLEALNKSVKLSGNESENLILAYYYLGLSHFAQENYPKCVKDFYNSCVIFKEGEKSKNKNFLSNPELQNAYVYSRMFAGYAFYKNHQFLNAQRLLENLICDGSLLSKQDYENSILMLFDSYLENENYDSLLKIYDNLNIVLSSENSAVLTSETSALTDETATKSDNFATLTDEIPAETENSVAQTANSATLTENSTTSSENPTISSETYYKLTLYAAQALELKGEYKNAYELYTKVMYGTNSYLASIALQKSYTVATNHKKEVNSEPGDVLEKVKDSLSDYKDLLSQFWTRLAIDSFNNGDFEKSKQYFKNTQENDVDGKYLALQGLYLSSIKLNQNPENALQILNEYYKKASVSQESEYYFDYLNSYAKIYAYLFDWQKSLENSKILCEELPNFPQKKYLYNEAIYWQSFALYNLQNYQDALLCIEKICPIVKNQNENSSNQENQIKIWYNANLLYAKILVKNQNENQAKKVFEMLENAPLKDQDRLDFAKVLFMSGYLDLSLRQALRVESSESYYICALDYFNKKDYVNAQKYFERYISSKSEEKIFYAKFYLGYCEYKLNQNEKAYNTFINLVQSDKNHNLSYESCINAVNAALQLKDFSKASDACVLAISCAKNQNQKEEAIILTADIFTDSKNYDKAISFLQESANQNNEFGMKALYKIAQIYEKQEKWNESDQTFLLLATKFPNSSFADESFYRRGELFYAAQKYQIAISRFKDYQKEFKKGKFLDASYFYMADSYAKINQNNFAILQYKYLIEFMPNSSYVFNSRKNLIKIYRSQANYKDALEQANILISQFPELSQKDEIYQEKIELEKLLSGEDEKYIKLQSEYKKNGSSSTKSGRILGTELCEYMWQNQNLKEDAFVLANELFSIQSQPENETSEAKYAARTSIIVAEYCRSKNDNLTSAQTYLLSAKYARLDSNHLLAQRALYGAVEAFDAASLTQDAKLACKTLNELYPESDYAKNASQLLLEE